MLKWRIFIVSLMSMFLFSCGNNLENEDSKKIKVVTTINYFEDMIKNIGGDKIDVEAIMVTGEDPHLYVATPKDVDRLSKATLVVYGGLHLEGKMGEVFSNLKNDVLDLSTALNKSTLIKEDENIYDPHVWFDTNYFKQEANLVKEKLSQLDPENKEYYENNYIKYSKQLDEVSVYIKNKINLIPENSRYLVTAHDAFSYFSRQFGLKVKAIQGVSTDAQIGIKNIDDLANFIATNKIKAIFVESSVNHKSIESLQEAVKSKNWDVKIGGELFSDSMGDTNTTNTYINVLKYNTDTIVEALK